MAANTDKKIILVTGSNTGIGYTTALELLKNPSHHVIISARSDEKGQKALESIHATSPAGSVSFLRLDITKEEDRKAAAKEIEQSFGRLDVLINNAGVILQNRELADDIKETFDTNSTSPVLLTYALAPLLQQSQDPRIIYVSSGLGSSTMLSNPSFGPGRHAPEVPYLAYRMSKAAVQMAAVYQSHEFGKGKWERPAKVWAFCPGYVESNLGGLSPEERKKSGALGNDTSAKGLVGIVEGRRDGEAGKFVHGFEGHPFGMGTYPF